MYKKLRAAVEKTAGRKMCAPTDFNYLSEDICEKTRITINPMTLKRFWGYFSNQETRNPRRFTLDVLCLYVGYQDWDAFIHDSTANVEIESDFIKNKCLYVSTLEHRTNCALLGIQTDVLQSDMMVTGSLPCWSRLTAN